MMIRKWRQLFVLVSVAAIATVAFAGFDGDDRSDVFTVRPGGELDWYKAVEGVYRTVERVTTTSSGVADIAIGDVTGDGYSELIIARINTGLPLTILKSTGVPGEYTTISLNQGTGTQRVAIGDFDGDEYADLFTINAEKNLHWLEWNPATNSFAARKWSLSTSALSVAVGDLDRVEGFGRDLLVGRETGLSWYEADGDNNYYHAQSWWWPSLAGITALAMGDVTGNGNTDVFFIRREADYDDKAVLTWREFRTDELGNMLDPVWRGRVVGEGDFVDVAIGDFDRSGRLTVAATTDTGQVRWFVARAPAYRITEVDGGGGFTYPAGRIEVRPTTKDFVVENPCGGLGRQPGDLTGDCQVGWDDLLKLSEGWLE